MKSNTYLALTIGPIYRTFDQCKRTRSVWASSFFFSWFIKQIAKRSAQAGFNILLPHHDAANPHQSQYGSGLYADRIYFEPSGKTTNDLQEIVNEIIAEIANDIVAENSENVNEYLHQYLNIHIVEKEIDENAQVLHKLNEALDQQELKQNFPFENENNPLLQYFDRKLTDESILVKDAFGGGNGLRFRSIPEIATASLERSFPNEYKELITQTFKNIDLDFIDALENMDALKKSLKPHHKYYAVLYADGDNIGALLNQISGDFGKLKDFSFQLFQFGKGAEKIIHQYGGSAVYLGGEDILAFLPMACISEDKTENQTITNTIFNVIDQLDVLFAETIGELAKKENVNEPTLTYGVNISYIKHPLKESMKKAHQLMDEVKHGMYESGEKKFPCKNAVGFRLQKHSGQYMECFYEKSKTGSWNEVKSFVEKYSKNAHQGNAELGNADLLSGVIHRLKDDLFFETFAAAARAKRLVPFFENFFNEYIHRQIEKKEFIDGVKTLSEKIFSDYPDNQNCRDVLFTTMRYVHFINSDKE